MDSNIFIETDKYCIPDTYVNIYIYGHMYNDSRINLTINTI